MRVLGMSASGPSKVRRRSLRMFLSGRHMASILCAVVVLSIVDLIGATKWNNGSTGPTVLTALGSVSTTGTLSPLPLRAAQENGGWSLGSRCWWLGAMPGTGELLRRLPPPPPSKFPNRVAWLVRQTPCETEQKDKKSPSAKNIYRRPLVRDSSSRCWNRK